MIYKMTFLVVMAMLCLKFTTLAQLHDTKLKPVNIGETLPKLFYQNHFSFYRKGKVTAQNLSKYPPLIILDLWARYCTSCIKALPKVDTLNQKFNGQAQIVPIGDSKTGIELQTLLKRFGKDNLQSPQILNNPVTTQLFPFQILPHIIWIYGGKVVAITDSEYLNALEIEKALKALQQSEAVDLPLKKDLMVRGPFEFAKFGIPSMAIPKPFFYSTFMGYAEGLIEPREIQTDTANGIVKLGVYNKDLLYFARLLYDNKALRDTNLFDLRVAEKNRYIKPKGVYYLPWAKQNCYSYETSMPIETDMQTRLKLRQMDIQKWLLSIGIRVEIERNGINGANRDKIIVTEIATP